jgi:7-cyano-7-deazaguanine reductase
MDELKSLGHTVEHVYKGADAKILEKVPNPMILDNVTNATITIVSEEFTSVCPVTGGPDFGKITIYYEPDMWIVESKSLKLYFESYRQEPTFHERVVAKICSDLANLLDPMWIEVDGEFRPRGGLAINPHAEYNWEDEAEDEPKAEAVN